MIKISKKIIIGICICMFSFGLNGCDRSDTFKCHQSVADKYPNAIIKRLPNNKYKFIVIEKSGNINYVETMNITNTDITEDVILFLANEFFKGEEK